MSLFLSAYHFKPDPLDFLLTFSHEPDHILKQNGIKNRTITVNKPKTALDSIKLRTKQNKQRESDPLQNGSGMSLDYVLESRSLTIEDSVSKQQQ
jgi:hypothetical protein